MDRSTAESLATGAAVLTRTTFFSIMKQDDGTWGLTFCYFARDEEDVEPAAKQITVCIGGSESVFTAQGMAELMFKNGVPRPARTMRQVVTGGNIGLEWGKGLLEALGLSDQRVARLTIDILPRGAVEIAATILGDKRLADVDWSPLDAAKFDLAEA